MESGTSIGKRVARFRRMRGMSQTDLAVRIVDRGGRASKDYVSKVERGTVPFDKISTVSRFAEALGVELTQLLGQPQALAAPGDGELLGIPAIEAALTPASLFVGQPSSDDAVYDLAVLRTETGLVWGGYQGAEYSVMGETLPGLIARLQAAMASATGPEREEAAGLLTLVYCATKSLLAQVGELHLATTALERAIATADASHDPLLRPLVLWHLAAVYLGQGRFADALRVAEAEVNRLSGQVGSGSAPLLSLYGGLATKGAVAASRLERGDVAWALWAEANVHAQRIGDRNDYWTLFGPTNARMIATSLAVELGQPEVALRQHGAIDPAAMPSRGRMARHLVTVSRAQMSTDANGEACSTLLEAERLAPEQLRYKPLAVETVRELRRRQRTGPLEELAVRIGVDD